jgi:exosortase/archaeosortase family protein
MPRTDTRIPHLPDGVIGNEAAQERPRSPWLIVLLFAMVFGVLQTSWWAARGTAMERAVIHTATVVPAAALVGWIDPALEARPRGATIEARGGGLNVLRGCEGVEILFLLVAALVALPLGWKRRAVALLLGTLMVFVLNQARIVALFFAWRVDRTLFEVLHSLALPALLVIAVTVFVHLTAGAQRRAGTLVDA